MKDLLGVEGLRVESWAEKVDPHCWLLNTSHKLHYEHFPIKATKTALANRAHPAYIRGWGDNSFAFRPVKKFFSINWIDGNSTLFQQAGLEVWELGAKFISRGLERGIPVSIRCDKGLSRSPTLAFVWLCANGYLPSDFREAQLDFLQIFPHWDNYAGITYYAEANWEELMTLCKISPMASCTEFSPGSEVSP